MAGRTSKTCLAKKLQFPAKKTGRAIKKGAPNIRRALPWFSLVQAPRAPFARLAVSLAGGLSEVTAL
jgi:hypothetical protein